MDTLKIETLPCLCGEIKYTLTFAHNKLLNGDQGASVITCTSCDLMRTTPRPLVQVATTEELYQDQDYFAGARENANLWYQMQTPIIEDVKRYKKNGAWLDIGSGLGFLPAVAKKHGFEARGIDLNKSVVKEGQDHFNHPVSLSSFEEIKDESFDIISINHVLEHVEDPKTFLTLAATKLKRDGILVIGVPNIMGGVPRLIRFLNSLGLKRGSNWLWHGYQLSQHLWHFTPKSLVQNLPSELTPIDINQSDNMFYGFLQIRKLRYRILSLIFASFEMSNMGDNLRVFVRKKSHE